MGTYRCLADNLQYKSDTGDQGQVLIACAEVQWAAQHQGHGRGNKQQNRCVALGCRHTAVSQR